MKRLIAAWRRYAAHPDPVVAAGNGLALLLGSNGPIYPLYLLALLGRPGLRPGLLTLFALPFFLAVPALSRRNPSAALLLLALTGTANTLWCLKLMGPASGVGLFLIPCILVACLLYRRRDLPWFLLAAAIPALGLIVRPGFYAPALIPFTPTQLTRLAAMHHVSVAGLMLYLVWRQTGLLRGAEKIA